MLLPILRLDAHEHYQRQKNNFPTPRCKWTQHYIIKQSGKTLFVHIQQKDVKLYLILILFSPLHLSWGIGQVLWTFIKLVLHSVDGMATGEEKEETHMLKIINVCTCMCLHVGHLKFEIHMT